MNKNKNVLTICEIIFSIVACIFLIVAACMVIKGIQFEKNGKKTTAKIVDISSYSSNSNYRKHSGRRKDSSRVTICYWVDGTRYVKTLHEYSSSWREGDTVDVYYNIEDPLEVHIKSMLYFLPIIFGILGVVLLIPVIILEINRRRLKKKQKSLMETGKKVYAMVSEVRENPYLRVNGRHPYQAIVIYNDEYTGMTYQFKSKNFFDDFINLVGREVPVYFNPKNPTEYYVDVESLLRIKCEL